MSEVLKFPSDTTERTRTQTLQSAEIGAVALLTLAVVSPVTAAHAFETRTFETAVEPEATIDELEDELRYLRAA